MELTAYHEAGHAFMATVLGAKVRSVTIEPDDDDGPERFGDTQIVWKRSRFSDSEFCERAIQVALAGPVAEMLYSGEPYHPGLVPEWANDWQSAWELAESLFAAPRQRLDHLEKVVSRLYRLLDTEPNWSAVAAIADSLLAHETLEFDEVKQIVSDWLD